MSGMRVSARVFPGFVALLALVAGCAPETSRTPDPAPGGTAKSGPPSIWVELSQIVIQYRGAASAPPEIVRTKDEALQLAAEISHKVRAGADFAELARQHSDDPNSAPKGGVLGVFHTSNMEPEIATACAALAEGGVSDPVESKFGFHVIRRDRMVEMASVRHILVTHTESVGTPPHADRTRDEARARAAEALGHVRAGLDFAVVAAEYSDDGTSAEKGGRIEPVPRGVGNAGFNAAVFELEVDELSEVVETTYGFHVIQRLR